MWRSCDPLGRTTDIQTPRLISGRYRLGDVLGRSLMSEVHRGEDVVLERPVAIKLLLDHGDPRSVARFEQEAQILARLQHPSVITVFDTGVDGGDRFIVMELVEGPSASGSCSTPRVGSRPNERARSRAPWPPPWGSPTQRPSSTATSNRPTCCSRPTAG